MRGESYMTNKSKNEPIIDRKFGNLFQPSGAKNPGQHPVGPRDYLVPPPPGPPLHLQKGQSIREP